MDLDHARFYLPIETESGKYRTFLYVTRKLPLKLVTALTIQILNKNKINLNNRFVNWDGHSNCLMSVDGSDFRACLSFWPGYYSHKFNSSGLRYEVALCIQTGWIVWINGPYPAGKWPDITIYRHRLKNHLLENEVVEADKGYRGDSTTVCPDDCLTFGEWQLKFHVRARHETVNKRMKDFKVLSDRFRHKVNRHDLSRHELCFTAVAIITQIHISTFEPLFSIHEYDFFYAER